MRVCAKCGEPRPESDFLWDDGIRQGVAKRCRQCRSVRRSCPDCEALWNGRRYSRKSRPPRCDACREASRMPGLPRERFHIKGHALVRYQQRVRPDLERRCEVLHEMIRVMELAPLVHHRPAWYGPVKEGGTGVAFFGRGYLMISEDVVFCLADYGGRGVMVSTVITSDVFVPPPAIETPRWVEVAHAAYLTRVARNEMERATRAS